MNLRNLTNQRQVCKGNFANFLSVWRFAVFSLFFASLEPIASAEEPRDWVKMHLAEYVELYQQLHQKPELSHAEQETAARLAAEWKRAGIEVTTAVGGHGVVGLIKNGDGPTLMLRCDLDGLPVTELTQLPYASNVKVKTPDGEVGVMHACGHDIHITNLAAVGAFLASHQDLWRGTVMLIGQPAEERVEGAKKMLDDGLFTRFPKPDLAVALHVDSNLPTGVVAVSGGYVLANSDAVDITLKGRGGHGAAPHATIDPIVMAAELVLSLQTIVSRELKPTEPAVITVGSIHGGSKHNIIGDTCHLQLTVRSYSDEVRKQLHEAIERKAKAVATGAGAPAPIVVRNQGTPALFNDEELAGQLRQTFVRLLGNDKVKVAEKSMGAEDFSVYGKAGVPVVMYRLGSVDGKRLERFKALGVPPPSLHSAQYYPDAEAALEVGTVTMASVVLDLLKK